MSQIQSINFDSFIFFSMLIPVVTMFALSLTIVFVMCFVDVMKILYLLYVPDFLDYIKMSPLAF